MAFLDGAYNAISSSPIMFGALAYLFILSFFLKTKFEKSPWFYVLIIVVPLIFSIGYTYSKKLMEMFTTFFSWGATLASPKNVLIALVAFGLLWGISKVPITAEGIYIAEYSFMILAILIALVGLSILYKMNQTYIYNLTGITGFIVNFILFIPCLISDFVEYLYGEFATTPKIVYILFVIELILILLYLYLPKIMKRINERFGKVIVDKPERINMRKDATNYIDMQSTEVIDLSSSPVSQQLTRSKLEINIRKKFAMSMWVYIVPMPTNHIPYNKDATILDFASHPRIVYDGSQRIFRIYYSETKNDQFDAPLEKWNNIFVNYDKDTIDMYLNGELKTTIPREEQTGGFLVGDILTIGQDNGLQGGIAKVVYYERPLLLNEIRNVYSYNKDLVGIE